MWVAGSRRGAANVQVEPELGLYADIVYARDGRSVERLVPRRVAAFNDCSIRQLEGASKLSQKKNWGFGSKGGTWAHTRGVSSGAALGSSLRVSGVLAPSSPSHPLCARAAPRAAGLAGTAGGAFERPTIIVL